ncbi:uncharacterized protein LOC126832771 [Adelges cooleyi]|uniref:uncharacterized protein LOC126832771 n=1 Tax=Adelges cooleyi TaxID=133065 RepID=UPI00217FA81E|nr:uncharacterized protein LOC126832771 [Adelges cooleyi]
MKMMRIALLNFCLLGLADYSFGVPFGIRSLNDAVFANPMGTKPCKVAGVFYNHSQKILFTDRCKSCLCIDGQIFCYWQCDENVTADEMREANDDETLSTSTTNSLLTSTMETEDSPRTTSPGPSTRSPDSSTQITATVGPNKTTTEPFCLVMGVKYKPGSVLPRDSGSCLECQCGQNSQITCNPKDCITLNSLNDQDTAEPEFFGNRNGEQNNENFNLDMFAVNVV